MKPKQLLAILLALLMLAALLAGCKTDINLGPDPDEEPSNLTPGAYAELLDEVGASDYEGMDDAQRKALEDKLRNKGFLPEDVTLPGVSETAPVVKATTMPQGIQIKPSEVYPLVKKVQDIFNSGTFYLKGRGAAPTGIGSGGFAPMVIAVDKDKVMTETEIDWTGLMKASPQGGAAQGDAGMSTVQGAIWQASFGRKFRMVFTPDGVFWAFPDKKSYVDLASWAMAEEGVEGLETSEMSGIAQDFKGLFGGRETPKDIPSSKIKVDGKEYLCGTFYQLDEAGKPLKDAKGQPVPAMRYFFLDGKFKRVEVFAQYEEDNVVYEIEEFSGKVDPALFSMKGYSAVPVKELMNLGGGLSSMIGG